MSAQKPPKTSASVGTAGKSRSISARMRRIRLEDDGRTLSMTFTSETVDGRSGPIPPGFDPWTADVQKLIDETPDIQDLFFNPMLSQAIAATSVLHMREAIEKGQLSVLEGMVTAVRNGLSIPDWLSHAFVSRYIRYQRFECQTLDETFGVKPLNKRTLEAARKRSSAREQVSSALVDLIHEDPTRPIDKGLFELAAERLGMGVRQCEELYYEGVNKFEMQELGHVKKLLRKSKKSG